MKKVRKVLLDASFIGALLDEEAPAHVTAKRTYAELLDAYQAEEDRLFALDSVLRAVPRDIRRHAFAPVLASRDTYQHQVSARRIDIAPPDVAIALVMMRRQRLRVVVTTTHAFDDFDVDVIYVPADGTPVDDEPGAVLGDRETADALSSPAALPSVPQSTDE